jgi:hypothetical protein
MLMMHDMIGSMGCGLGLVGLGAIVVLARDCAIVNMSSSDEVRHAHISWAFSRRCSGFPGLRHAVAYTPRYLFRMVNNAGLA